MRLYNTIAYFTHPYLRIVQFRIICEIVTHPKPLPQSLVITYHIHLTWVTTVTLWHLTLWLRMKSGHGFCKPIDWISVVIINRNYNKKNITKSLVRAFKQLLQRIASFRKYDKGKIIWWRSWWWPSLRGCTPSVNLSSTSVHLFTSGLVMFPSGGYLRHPLLFGLLC
jgi:hypothetical protein